MKQNLHPFCPQRVWSFPPWRKICHQRHPNDILRNIAILTESYLILSTKKGNNFLVATMINIWIFTSFEAKTRMLNRYFWNFLQNYQSGQRALNKYKGVFKFWAGGTCQVLNVIVLQGEAPEVKLRYKTRERLPPKEIYLIIGNKNFYQKSEQGISVQQILIKN